MIKISNIELIDLVEKGSTRIAFARFDYEKSRLIGGSKKVKIEITGKWSTLFNEFLSIRERSTGKYLFDVLNIDIDNQIKNELFRLVTQKPLDNKDN